VDLLQVRDAVDVWMYGISTFTPVQHGPTKDFINDRNTRLSSIMTPVKELVTAKEGIDLLQANKLLQTSKKGKLPIITETGLLVALVARTDIKLLGQATGEGGGIGG